MATLVEWFPADGSAQARFTTGAAAPLRLLRFEGTEPVTVEPVTVRSPNQPGATALDVVVPPRVVTLGGLLQAATPAAAWDLRAALLRSFSQQPTRLADELTPDAIELGLGDALPAVFEIRKEREFGRGREDSNRRVPSARSWYREECCSLLLHREGPGEVRGFAGNAIASADVRQ